MRSLFNILFTVTEADFIITFFCIFFTVTEAEKRRLQDAFRRLSASSGHVSRPVFIKEVVGDALPALLAEQIYR